MGSIKTMTHRHSKIRRIVLSGALCALNCLGNAGGSETAPNRESPVTVKVFSLPSKRGNSPMEIARYRILERFRQLHPDIRLASATALQIEGDTQDAAPLMAIAGGTSPDILFVNFRQSDTYISRGFLHPLDE